MMEIVTVSKEESLRYVGRLVTMPQVNKVYSRRLPNDIDRQIREFVVFSHIGYRMYYEGIPPRSYAEYVKRDPLWKYAGPVEVAFTRYGLQGYDLSRNLNEREIYVFSKLAKWARRRLYVPARNACNCEHSLAWMFPRCFEERTRGFMISEDAYSHLTQANPATGGMLRAITGKLVVIE